MCQNKFRETLAEGTIMRQLKNAMQYMKLYKVAIRAILYDSHISLIKQIILHISKLTSNDFAIIKTQLIFVWLFCIDRKMLD